MSSTFLTIFREKLNGNLTAVFSLLFDNLVNLTVIQASLNAAGASTATVTPHLFLGSLSGVIAANFAVFYFVNRWNTGLDITIPIGIDAPSVFFMSSTITGIYDSNINDGQSSDDALRNAWASSCTIVMILGLVKLCLALLYLVWDFTIYIKPKIFYGCLAGIGLALLGMNNFSGIFQEPLTGLVSLFVLFMFAFPEEGQSDTLNWREYVVSIQSKLN
jgi:hypothetical protein